MPYEKILLDLLEKVTDCSKRIAILEKIVNELKEEKQIEEVKTEKQATSRDTTKYIFEGKRYGKNRLVLAVVKKYMELNPNTTAEQLLLVFDKSLQGSLGVVRILFDVEACYDDYQDRFFTKPNEIIETITEPCVVCTQWKLDNIGNFITRANQLNMKIEIIK